MSAGGFSELALQYVLGDDSTHEAEVASTAATRIQDDSTDKRAAVLEWVSSINRWMPQPNDGDSQDDDIISRTKALDFLTSTLLCLRDNVLRADQIQLLVKFFCSLFSHDHKAGITPAARALNRLTTMTWFKPPLAIDIAESLGKLGDDFVSQTPYTRFECYELILRLLQDQTIASELEHKYGNASGFMIQLLHLCRNERDPKNLMKWFEALKIFLQNFSPSDDVTLEVFKRFSAYFPIALRASATPSGITPEDLKGAVRSCFAAHHRLARHTIPYLIAKLDQGDAVTVAVKVDILLTLDACVIQYGHPQQSVVPYVDQIWNSLKYEVRNGDVEEIVEATLKVIHFLTRRLDGDDLRSFFNTVWQDLTEDLASPTYILPAGKLLMAILGASTPAFSMVSPALSQIQGMLKSTETSSSHKRDLVALLNGILLVRAEMVARRDAESLKDPLRDDIFGLKDDLFGDKLYFETYLPLWRYTENLFDLVDEHMEILRKLMEGMAAIVNQKSYRADPHRLTTDDTCEEIFKLLAGFTIKLPLEEEAIMHQGEVYVDKIRRAATLALEKAAPQYPQGYQQLLFLYARLIREQYPRRADSSDYAMEIRQVAVSLYDIAHAKAMKSYLALSDFMVLIHVFLDAVFWMLEKRAHPKYCSVFISAINLAVLRSVEIMTLETYMPNLELKPISAEVYADLSFAYEKLLDIELFVEGTGEPISQTARELRKLRFDDHQQLLTYCLCVLKKLCHRFTQIYPHPQGSSVGLHKDFLSNDSKLVVQYDVCLHQLAMLAGSVVRIFTPEEQKALGIGEEAFRLFHPGIPVKISHLHDYRTAPLSMGILRGIHPGALNEQDHLLALLDLNAILIKTPTVPTPTVPSSEVTRVALDTIWTTLSNKFVVKGDERKRQWSAVQDAVMTSFTTIWKEDGSEMNGVDAVRIFRSILHFLSGDVARFNGDPKLNRLLHLVSDMGPAGPASGRVLAKNFEILLCPQECLHPDNHAIRKKLAGQWIYQKVLQPNLKGCFPTHGSTIPYFLSGHDEEVQGQRQALARAVSLFSMLKYAQYEWYADDVAMIVRIAINCLSLLESGVEMASCLTVVMQILEKEPKALKGHLSSLTHTMGCIYLGVTTKCVSRGETARPSDSDAPVTTLVTSEDAHALVFCRKMALEFVSKLPTVYPPSVLIPFRDQLTRPLRVALGDPVRELRRLALAARKAWDDLK